MSEYHILPTAAYEYLAIFILLLSVAAVFGLLLALREKNRIHILHGIGLAAALYLLLQVLLDMIWEDGTHLRRDHPSWLGQINLQGWCTYLLLAALLLISILYYVFRWQKQHITLSSIQDCADQLPTGLLYWREGGHILFSNPCIQELSRKLTGEMLRNGESFYQTLKDRAGSDLLYLTEQGWLADIAVTEQGRPADIAAYEGRETGTFSAKTADSAIVRSAGKMWEFHHSERTYRGEILHELILADVTELASKNMQLKKETEELKKMDDALKAYNLQIDDTVRRQELLQAKINIHDDMNRLILLTSAATENESMGDLGEAFAMWKSNALLLGKQSGTGQDRREADQNRKLAEMLGVKLIQTGKVPEDLSAEKKELVNLACREAIANAVKHGSATFLSVHYEADEQNFTCTFTNDGTMPEGKIRFTGGLTNLLRMTREQDGSLTADADTSFRLKMVLPR